MFVVLIFPVLLFLLAFLTLSSKRKAERAHLGASKLLIIILGLLMPWIMIMATLFKGQLSDSASLSSPLAQTADLWLLSCQAMLALVLLLVRDKVESHEAWFKAFVSFTIGLFLLELSLHPAIGLPFAITTLEANFISAISFVLGVFLLFALPPLQLGTVDLGSEKNVALHMILNLGIRLSLGFVILVTLGYNSWLAEAANLIPLVAAAIFIGVALTRLVLRLQTNIFRMMAYIASGLALPLAVKILFAEYGELYFFVQGLALVPLVAVLNEASPAGSEGRDHQSWAFFRRHSPETAERFHMALKIFLYLELGVALVLVGGLCVNGHLLTAAAAAFWAFSTLVVNLDKQAFAPNVAV